KGRATGGVRTLTITKKTGPVCTVRSVKDAHELMLISASGIIIRTPINTISRQGRTAQGVTLMNLKPGDKVAAVALLNGDNEGDVDEDELTGTNPAAKPRAAKAKPRGGEES